jgi:UDP-N-acetylglucosamine--N-acetylmuramyl-(pentapeptide) pyrophosphoryl-undecaprenol N-acetylglucosamine transferase
MRFLFTCGGTAGHVNPALAVAGEIRRLIPDAGILFVGSGRPMENRLITREGYELINIPMTGFSRGLKPSNITRNLKTVKNLFVSSRRVSKILRDFRPDVAVGTGGYVCYPVLKKAAAIGIPTVIHESNAVPA